MLKLTSYEKGTIYASLGKLKKERRIDCSVTRPHSYFSTKTGDPELAQELAAIAPINGKRQCFSYPS